MRLQRLILTFKSDESVPGARVLISWDRIVLCELAGD